MTPTRERVLDSIEELSNKEELNAPTESTAGLRGYAGAMSDAMGGHDAWQTR